MNGIDIDRDTAAPAITIDELRRFLIRRTKFTGGLDSTRAKLEKLRGELHERAIFAFGTAQIPLAVTSLEWADAIDVVLTYDEIRQLANTAASIEAVSLAQPPYLVLVTPCLS